MAPLIVRTGLPALAFGGYTGTDPIFTLETFAALVARGEVRYVLLPGGRARQNELMRWARERGTPVDAALWRSSPPDEGRRPVALYDLGKKG